MLKKFTLSFATIAALFFLSNTQVQAILCFEGECTDGAVGKHYSKDGHEAVCLVEIIKNGKEYRSTGVLVHPSFVLTSEHVIQESYSQVYGFLAAPEFTEPEKISVIIGSSSHSVADILDNLEVEAKAGGSNEEADGSNEDVRKALLTLSSIIQKELGGNIDCDSGLKALNTVMSEEDAASDYILLELQKPVTDIIPMQMRPLAFGEGSEIRAEFTMCGYGNGAVLLNDYQSLCGWERDEDVLSIINQGSQFRKSLADCIIKKKVLPYGLADEDSLLYVFSDKQTVLHGDSGSPLIAEDGHIVAIAQGISSECDDKYYELSSELVESRKSLLSAWASCDEDTLEKAKELYREHVTPVLKKIYVQKRLRGSIGVQYTGITAEMINGMKIIFDKHDVECVAKEAIESILDNAFAETPKSEEGVAASEQ